MFAIDLLKGKGVPRRPSPRRLALQAVPLAVPVLAVVLWAVSFQRDCALAADRQRAVEDNRAVVEAAAKDVKAYQHINAAAAAMKTCLNEIHGGLAYRIQVSDLLVELAQTLPPDIFVYEIKLARQPELRKTTDPKTGNSVQTLLLKRHIKMILCGFDAESADRQVGAYVERLKQSDTLSTVFTDFKMTAQQQGQVDGRTATYYEIECVLREQG